MKVQVNREGDTINAKSIKIKIDGLIIKINETNDGRIRINKEYGSGNSDAICVYPAYSNEIIIA